MSGPTRQKMENVTEFFLSDRCRKYDGMDFKIILVILNSSCRRSQVSGVRVPAVLRDLDDRKVEDLLEGSATSPPVVVGVGVGEAPTQPAQLRSLV